MDSSNNNCIEISFFKVTSLPTVGKPDSIYLLLNGLSVQQYVTDRLGNFLSAPGVTETLTVLSKVGNSLKYKDESGLEKIINFSQVAFTGDYNDLTNTISNTSDLTNDGDGVSPFVTVADIPTNLSDLTLDVGIGSNIEFDTTFNYILKLVDQNTNLLGSVEITTANIKELSSYTGLDTRYYTKTQLINYFSGTSPITGYNKTNWDTAFGWGNHADAGYLTVIAEEDPFFTASPAATITNTNISNWNTAYGWGDHSIVGYLTSFTETDPVFAASDAASVTASLITNWNTAYTTRVTASGFNTGTGDLTLTRPGTTNLVTNLNGRYSLLGHTHTTAQVVGLDSTLALKLDISAYNSSISDYFGGVTPITGYNKTDWDTAFGWGDHSVAGYATETLMYDELLKKVQVNTGYVVGMEITVNAVDNSKFDIAPGVYVVTDYSDLYNVVTQYVTYAGATGVTPAYLATNNASYVGISLAGTVVQGASPFTNEDRRSIVSVGATIHSDNTTINVVNEIKFPIVGIGNQMHDIIKAIGALNLSGNVYSPNGANLSLNKSAGVIWGLGINALDYTNPHQLTLGEQLALTFRYRLRDGTEYTDRTTIDPEQYDAAGVLTTVGNNKFTIQRINIFQSGITRIQYGQTEYNNLSSAKAGVLSDPYVTEQNIAENAIFRAYLIIKKGVTNLTTALAGGDAEFIHLGKFGASATGAGVSITNEAVITALGYTPENVANKATTYGIINNTLYPTLQATENRYSQLGHTHTFTSITSKPTTIAGYGITDFNSLGDARWLKRTTDTFNGTLTIENSANLEVNFNKTTAPLDQKSWDFVFTDDSWLMRAVNDANSFATTPLSFIRSGTTITNINTVSTNFTHTGDFTVTGGIYEQEAKAYDTSANKEFVIGGTDNGYVNNAAASHWRSYISGDRFGQSYKLQPFLRGTGYVDRFTFEQTGNFTATGAGTFGGKLFTSGAVPANFIADFENTDTGTSSNGIIVRVNNASSNNTVQRWYVNGGEVGRFGADGVLNVKNIGIFGNGGGSASPLRLYGSSTGTTSQNYILFTDSLGSSQYYIGDASSGASDLTFYNYTGLNYLRILGGGGNDGLFYNWSGGSGKVWHAGNDGSGSGLDADLLDGVNSGSFLRSDASDTFTATELTIGGGSNLRVDNTMDVYGTTFWKVSLADQAAQRCDARDDSTTNSRLHWYGITDTGGTNNFRHAWYDGSNYINVTAGSGAVTWTGGGVFDTLQTNKTGAGNDLLIFNTERPWRFRQGLSGASTSLDLIEATGSKVFNIGNGADREMVSFSSATGNVATKGTIVAQDSISIGNRAVANSTGRGLLLEAAASATGEGSGRLFISEHNVTSGQADSYGLSLYYEGEPNIQLPSGFQPNTGNATWSLRRHDNSVNGVAIMSGYRTSNDVYFSGNIVRTGMQYGGLVGDYSQNGSNSTGTYPIYSLGTGFLPNSTTLANMYGIGYTNGANATFLNSTDLGTTPGNWGMYVAADGNARIWLDGGTGITRQLGISYASNFQLNSDERRKNNIQDYIPSKMDVQWKSFELKTEKGVFRVGVSAQQLLKTHPEFVDQTDPGSYTVKYFDLLCAKMAEKDEQIIELKKQNQDQGERLALLEEKLKILIEKIL